MPYFNSYDEEFQETYPLLYARWLSDGPAYDPYDKDTKIQNYYWWLAPISTMTVALQESGIVDNAQRNPLGYTALELAEKIAGAIDETISYKSTTWTRKDFYFQGLEPSKSQGYRLDQAAFWQNTDTHLVYFPEQYIASRSDMPVIDVIVVPGTVYDYNPDEFKLAPWASLGAHANNYGQGLTLDGNNRISGIAAERAYFTFAGSTFSPSVYYIHSNDYYHRANPLYGGDDLNPYGQISTFNDYQWVAVPDDWDDRHSWKYKRSAFWDVTISGGKVTALTPAARLDGSGDSIVGGWGFSDDDDDYAVIFQRNPAVADDPSVVEPRVYMKLDGPADGSHSGNKVKIDINDSSYLFYPGKNVPDNYYDRAIATNIIVDNPPLKSPFANVSGIADEKQWYQRNWAPNIEPAAVRITTEKPRLKSTTRSLKTTEVGIGAHRMSFEFEYAPMTQTYAEVLIQKFEEYVGKEIQLWVPKTAIRHFGAVSKEWDLNTSNYMPRRPTITSGKKGDNRITTDGWYNDKPYAGGWYFTTNERNKIYKTLSVERDVIENKVAFVIEPPLIEDSEGMYMMAWNNSETEANYLLIRAFIIEDTFDYTVDAAGYYRMSIKFREAI